MAKTFVPYPELEDDLDHLRAKRCMEPKCPQRKRLLAAFKEPECGAMICLANGTLVYVHSNGEWIDCVCRQPRGHDGPHIPDLPAECWTVPDE
jgi:hypothetical protein